MSFVFGILIRHKMYSINKYSLREIMFVFKFLIVLQ